MQFDGLLFIYLTPLALIWFVLFWRNQRKTRANLTIMAEAREAGLTEPPSLHPLIDEAMCIGCGACVTACPEGSILGMIDGTAHLIEPTHCIGHGACAAACPGDAITLVFGTERRGVEIPDVSPIFQTNVPGIYIAGELGGMGLVRNAIEQGRQAMDNIADRLSDTRNAAASDDGMLDVLIVGAGPAGISASLGAKQRGLRFETIDQDSLGGTVAHFPRGKLVMTAPAELPIYGRVNFREISKEKLLEFWQGVIDQVGLAIRFQERIESIERVDDAFTIRSDQGTYRARAVLLAIGRRGTPRQLGVPGEDQAKVVYRMIDPAQYRGCHVLVVGGGDSALEAATTLAAEEGTTVTLSHRGAVFDRARARNRTLVDEAEASGRLTVYRQSQVEMIGDDHVRLHSSDGSIELRNDSVIICVGGILPNQFLQQAGIRTETKYGTA